ncbi:hypothetical protein Hanom_Chr16g01459091 [Helianthus anomalus]
MLMHGFPIFSFIYLPVFYTTPNPRERWTERERSATVKVMWFEPPHEHLPLANTTTGVPCRHTNTIGVPCRCRTPCRLLTPPEFPATA